MTPKEGTAELTSRGYAPQPTFWHHLRETIILCHVISITLEISEYRAPYMTKPGTISELIPGHCLLKKNDLSLTFPGMSSLKKKVSAFLILSKPCEGGLCQNSAVT